MKSSAASSKSSPSLYSLKPQRLMVPKDVSPILIFQQMLKEVKESGNKVPKRLEIAQFLLKTRGNLIQKIRNFILKFRLSANSFFLAIYYMDILLAKRINLSIDKIALGALILSVKFNDIDGKSPSICKFKNFNDNYTFQVNEMLKIEIECIKRLNYTLTYPHSIHFIQLLILNGIVFNTDIKDNNAINSSIYSYPSEILEHIVCDSAQYLSFDPFLLACACVSLSRELYGLDKWNVVLTKVFGVSFNMFADVFEYVKIKYEKRLPLNEKNPLKNKKTIEEEENDTKDLSSTMTSTSTAVSISSAKRLGLNNPKINGSSITSSICNSATKEEKRNSFFKSKSLDLNMQQLEEIIRSHKQIKKDAKLNVIKEYDASTNDDSLRNECSQNTPFSSYCANFGNQNRKIYQRNGVINNSYMHFNERETMKNYSTTYKKTINLNDTSISSLNSSQLNSSTSGNMSKFIPGSEMKNSSSKTLIPESARGKRTSCISFKNCALGNSCSMSNYTIKDFAKLKTIKRNLNFSFGFPRKIGK